MLTDYLIVLFKMPIALLISSVSLAPVVHCCFSNIWCQYFPKPLFNIFRWIVQPTHNSLCIRLQHRAVQ